VIGQENNFFLHILIVWKWK